MDLSPEISEFFVLAGMHFGWHALANNSAGADSRKRIEGREFPGPQRLHLAGPSMLCDRSDSLGVADIFWKDRFECRRTKVSKVCWHGSQSCPVVNWNSHNIIPDNLVNFVSHLDSLLII